MRQAIHIFRKDSRQFRSVILILLAWTVALVAASHMPWPVADLPDARRTHIGAFVQQFGQYLFPIGWCYLIAQVFHAEALPGNRQFWLTRPYHRGSLFAAKALFVVAYITIPMTLAQAAIVVSNGLPLTAHLAGLVWEQLLITAVVLLPAAALAAVTSTLTQFITALLAAPALLLAIRFLRPWGGVEWVRLTLVIAAAALMAVAILAVQFASRRTATSRIIALGGTLAIVTALPLLPWPAAFALQSSLTGPWHGTLSAELVRPEPKPPSESTYRGGIQLFFRLGGVPAGTVVVCEAREIAIEGADGQSWSSGVITGASGVTAEGECPVGLPVPRAFVDATADRPVTLRAVLYFTVFGPDQTTVVPVDQPPILIRNVGLCAGARIQTHVHVECRTAFREPRLAQSRFYVSPRTSYSPLPADFRLQPMIGFSTTFRDTAGAVSLTTRDPVAHVRTTVEARDVLLRDFAFGR